MALQERLRVSPESLQFILWGSQMSDPNFMAAQPKCCEDMSLKTARRPPGGAGEEVWNHQSQQTSSSGNHENLYIIVCRSIK